MRVGRTLCRLGVLSLLTCLSVAEAQVALDLVPDRSWLPEPGDQAIVYLESENTSFGSKDAFSYIALMKAVKASDKVGFAELVSQGQLVEVSNRTRVLVIERHTSPVVTGGVDAVEVRILDGEHRGKSAWISEALVARMIPRRQPSEFEIELRKKEQDRREAEERKAQEDAKALEAAKEGAARLRTADEWRRRSLRAATTLRSAQNLEKAKKVPASLRLYRQVIKDYPDMPEAKEAAERIKALGGQ
jgi:hypothetical protein